LRVRWRTHEHSRILTRETCLAVAVFQRQLVPILSQELSPPDIVPAQISSVEGQAETAGGSTDIRAMTDIHRFLAMSCPSRLLTEWLHVGGLYTLMSYGLTPSPTLEDEERRALVRELARVIPRRHLGFLSQLRLTFTCGDFFFVHACIWPGVPLAEQQEDDLLWIREEFLQGQQNFGKFVVHGHTPVRHPELLKSPANIDTRAYATGNLTLLTIQGASMLAV
jgi:hypothetical protein